MQTHEYTIAGEKTVTHFPETRDDFERFTLFLTRQDHNTVLGLDTETTGVNIYAPGFRCRLVQVGNTREAWVLDVERFGAGLIGTWLTQAASEGQQFVAHNAPFDLLVLDEVGIVNFALLAPLVHDTYILAHLLDPREQSAGGTGLGLKPLSTIYVDPEAPDTQAGLHKEFQALLAAWKKTVTKEEATAYVKANSPKPFIPFGFTNIAIDHPLYVLYAGLDVILTTRLLAEIGPRASELGFNDLYRFEQRVQTLTARMQRKGALIDVDYVENTLIPQLDKESEENRKVASRYGVKNPNSTTQIQEALLGMGVTLTEETDSSTPEKRRYKVGKEVLAPLADVDEYWNRLNVREPHPLASAIMHAKRAEKWRESYAQTFLDLRDLDNRIHPNIRSLAARTARMSVSNPPLQQLPSKGWTIRRAILADPGHLLIGVDYSAVEMRILAALANVSLMKELIANGADLHTETARMVFGAEFDNAEPKAKKRMRTLMKVVGFGKVYGGGARTIARQTGLTIEQVKPAIAGYDSVYPEIKQYGYSLQRSAECGGWAVTTPFGRRLPLDRDRSYSATNYVVQSSARDVFALALVRLDDAGLTDNLIMPVHDEIIAQAPAEEAEAMGQRIAEIMAMDFLGVPLDTEPEVLGRSWGHGSDYGATD